MSGFKKHAQHLAPQGHCLNSLVELQLAGFCHFLVLLIPVIESLSVQIVEIRHVTRAKESPASIFDNTLHEEIRNPVRGIHIMRTSTLVSGVLPELKKVFDIKVPSLKVSTHCPLPLTALVHSNSSVVCNLQKRNDSLACSVRPLNP